MSPTMRTASRCLLVATLAAVPLVHRPVPASAQATPTAGQALDLVREERWAEAAEAYRSLLESNPFAGTPWYYYGLALHRTGDCQKARSAYERAVALGVNGGRSGLGAAMSGAARCAASLGDLDAAFAWLAEASGRWEFRDWDSIESDPNFADLVVQDRYRLLAGRLDAAQVDRVTGWRFDIDYLEDLVVRRHPAPFHAVDEAAWRRQVAELREAVPTRTDLEVYWGVHRMLSAIGDGHTSLYPPAEGPLALHQLPIWPYVFGDDWRILAAAPEHADLVGARIEAVNGVPASDVFGTLKRSIPRDNEMTFRFLGPLFAQFSEPYYLASNAGQPTATRFALELPDGGHRTVVLEGGAVERNPNARWTPPGWPSMSRAAEPPLWLSHLDETFWFTDIADGVVYAQINQIANAEDERLEQFAARLDVHIRESGAEHLILDLRLNNGGNGYLNTELVRTLVRNETIDRDGGLYVLMGRRTFSAAVLLVGDLKRWTHAIFVGEPASSPPNFYGNDSYFSLPYSGLEGSITNGYHQRSAWEDLSPWTAPDVWAPLTPEDAWAGRDPALEAVLARIGG